MPSMDVFTAARVGVNPPPKAARISETTADQVVSESFRAFSRLACP